MKQNFISKMKSLRGFGTSLFLSGIFMVPAVSNAQSIINPVATSDPSYSTLTNQIYTLNTDMLEVPSGQLTTMAWDYYGPYPSSGVAIQIKEEFPGTVQTTFIASKAESQPDIVWATDPSSGNYMLGVVFLDINGYVNFNTYKVTGVGTSSLSIIPNTHQVLSSNYGNFPHIDMLPDYSTMFGGFPSMHRFSISWGEIVGSGISDIKEIHGDMNNPMVHSPITNVTTGGDYFYGGDLAVSLDPATKRVHTYISYSNGAVLKLAELQTNYAAGPIAPAILVSTNTIVSSSTPTLLPLVRIEAMGTNVIGSGIVPWVVDATQNGHLWEYNINGSFNCSYGISPTDYNICPAVTAGPGEPLGNVCNNNYNVGWHNQTHGYITQVVDAFTGYISTTYPDYYVANVTVVNFPGGSSKIPIALSSCSNSGNYLFTGFWDGGTNINYHLKAGIAGYKPGHTTGVGNVTTNEAIKAYPNPITDKMIISGLTKGTYNIVNIVGQVIKTGVIDKNNYELDLAKLQKGNYILSVQSTEGNKTMQFVKQ